ncbi:Anaphase-promoting complex subunit CDC26 [Penicillium verhagenii]|nr:Anaphase-promoting complex subunit CDC26 [Penicillium verhagenii]
MLRRKPTAITVTSEDIAAFEEARLRQLEENKHPEQAKGNKSNSNSNKYDPNDELKPLPGDKARIVRSREERIGIGRQG